MMFTSGKLNSKLLPSYTPLILLEITLNVSSIRKLDTLTRNYPCPVTDIKKVEG